MYKIYVFYTLSIFWVFITELDCFYLPVEKGENDSASVGLVRRIWSVIVQLLRELVFETGFCE
jgi:hypothetical protein